MIYQVAAVYLKESDEVSVETFIENAGAVVVPDSVKVLLQHETRDKMGLVRYLTVDELEVEKDFVSPNKHFMLRFKNPIQKLNLFVEVTFTTGTDVQVKRAFVGVPDSPQVTMDLPNNPQHMIEIEEEYYTPVEGGEHYLPDNNVVLASEITNSMREYEFTGTMSSEQFDGLEYTGGGSRLLTDQSTNMFVKQDFEVAPWDMKAFCFLEDSVQNLVDMTLEHWEVLAPGSLIEGNVSIDPKLCEDVPVWTLRCRPKSGNNFGTNEVILSSKFRSPVLATMPYCFSSYFQAIPKNKGTKINSIKSVFNWYDASELLIKRDVEYINPSAFKALNICPATFTAPANAAFLQVELRVSSLDAGEDMELKMFAPQVELGSMPTSRTLTYREADVVQVNNLNLEHFKLRTVFVSGFAHEDKAWNLVNGILKVSFANGTLKAVLGEETDSFYKVLETPFEYMAFDEVDVTFEVKSGEYLKVYRNGEFLSQITLIPYVAGFGALHVQGAGVELNKLLAFTWS